MLLRLPHQLQEPDTLLGIADTLLHLPETFPAAYLKVYDPIITQCLRLSGALQHIDLADILSFQIPQLDKTRLSDSLVGYGFLTTAQYIADLFFAVADVPGVKNASFPACYSDPDYWLGALLLAFESHQKGPLGRAAGLPVVLGFPETDNRITDLQVNVPPAAMVAFLAGRAYQLPTCPATKYVVDPQGLPQVHGQISQEALQAWAEAARRTNLETARLAQQPGVNAFVRISLQGSQTLDTANIKNLGQVYHLFTSLMPFGRPWRPLLQTRTLNTSGPSTIWSGLTQPQGLWFSCGACCLWRASL